MDGDLLSLLKSQDQLFIASPEERKTRLLITDFKSGEIEIEGKDGPSQYRLKSLAELYGKGVGAASVEPLDERYLPLFLCIEESIARYYRDDDGSLTDAAVQITLDRLGMSPESDEANDPLAHHIQLDLRLQLSVSDYSRQEVRSAIRKIGKSVARHSRISGVRGYLEFICEQLRM
jgi:hypothetical protein